MNGESVVEDDALFGKRLQVRGGVTGVSVEGKVILSAGVDAYEDHVRESARRRFGFGSGFFRRRRLFTLSAVAAAYGGKRGDPEKDDAGREKTCFEIPGRENCSN